MANKKGEYLNKSFKSKDIFFYEDKKEGTDDLKHYRQSHPRLADKMIL